MKFLSPTPPSSYYSLKPPLKWAGGKRWLLPELKALFLKSLSERLVEPFVGGLSVALGLFPSQAVLSDINPHLINFYQHLKRGLVINQMLEHNKEFFYRARAEFNALNDYTSKRSAELFYYLNKTCFNGLCRFNSKGAFNVPFGKYKSINYTKDFTPYALAFKNWSFLHQDFERIVLKESDFLYVDPPYDVEFTQYSKENFSWNDQVRLVSWLMHHRGPIVASNQATPRIIKLYSDAGFVVHLKDAPRMISSNGDRRKAKEMLAVKNISL